MSASNPFDQFADDFRAAIPGAPPKSEEPMLTMGPPVPAPAVPSKPTSVMNAPPMAHGPPQGAPPPMGAGMNPYGGFGGYPPPPPPNGGMPGMPGMNGMNVPNGMAMVPAVQQSNPYALPGMAPPPPSPFGGPPPVMGQPPAPPMGFHPMQQPAVPPPPATTPTIPAAAPPVPPSPSFPPGGGAPPPPAPPFGGVFGAPPTPPMPSVNVPGADPWGPSVPIPAAAAAPVPSNAMVPSTAAPDPFGGIFGAPTPAPPAPVPAPAAPVPPPPSNDPWGDMGFGTPPAPAPPPPPSHDDTSTLGGGTISDMRHSGPTTVSPEADFFSSGANGTSATMAAAPPVATTTTTSKKPSLPEGGEYFDARIFTPTLGVMFFKPQELTDSLFLNTDRSIVDALDERPTVAFIVEGSSARSAGVELGNVLLKVNGIDVKNPKEASRLIKEGPRPLPLLFYVPKTTVVVAEGEHMVKYDTRETGAPLSAKDWKPKYVVIGGIIAQPWMMNMYRSKVIDYYIMIIFRFMCV